MKNHVVLLLGSNLGERTVHLEKARLEIAQHIGQINKISALYETEPWGVEEQEKYLNQVLLVESELSPEEVLEEVLRIEQIGGRVRQEKWGARLIDIDILFYSDRIVEQDGLKIPHPYLHVRRFTLAPLVEILPDWLHPKLKQTVATLYAQLDDPLKVEVFKPESVQRYNTP